MIQNPAVVSVWSKTATQSFLTFHFVKAATAALLSFAQVLCRCCSTTPKRLFIFASDLPQRNNACQFSVKSVWLGQDIANLYRLWSTNNADFYIIHKTWLITTAEEIKEIFAALLTDSNCPSNTTFYSNGLRRIKSKPTRVQWHLFMQQILNLLCSMCTWLKISSKKWFPEENSHGLCKGEVVPSHRQWKKKDPGASDVHKEPTFTSKRWNRT